MTQGDRRVLIVGGGPVGLLCGWMLGRQGIAVRLFDNNDELQTDPRAATTHPATLDLIAECGLADEMAQVGLVAPIFQFWDRPSNRLVAQFDHSILADDTRHPFVVQCEQFKTSRLLLERLRTLRNVEILFGHEAVDVRQTTDGVTVDVVAAGRTESHSGMYLIGADGGRSVVRRRSEIPFEGFTWPERFIVLTTPFDFEANRGYSYRSYFAEPGAWCNCFKVSAEGPPGLWRTVFPTEPSQDDALLMNDAAVQARMQRFFPNDTPYDIVHRNLYVTHQRVAGTFRKGRVVLAGDAAHVNNPIGGMGLNGGIQDAVNLAGKLTAVLLEGRSDQLLDLYDLQRRTVAIEFVQEQSIANKKRLEESDPATRQKNLNELSRIAAEPERARQFLLRTSMIASQRRAEAMRLD
jgi:3-(3-hydroxy-phenyl)propionate hydroxylase